MRLDLCITPCTKNKDYNTVIVGNFTTRSFQQWPNYTDRKPVKNTGLKLYSKASGSNRHTQNIPFNRCRIHIVLNCTLNIFQNGPYIKLQNLNKFKYTEIISSIFPGHSGIKLESNNKRNIEKYMKIEHCVSEQPTSQCGN